MDAKDQSVSENTRLYSHGSYGQIPSCPGAQNAVRPPTNVIQTAVSRSVSAGTAVGEYLHAANAQHFARFGRCRILFPPVALRTAAIVIRYQV